MTQFLEDRLQTGKVHFFDPLKRNTLKSFASLNKPVPSKKKQATQTINIDRQIFSKLAVIGQSRDVNISELLQYELAPVPLSIVNLDGSLRKTQRRTILKWIEKDLSVPDLPVSNEPTLAVIDLMMLLRMVCTDTLEYQTFGALSDDLLNIILGLGCKYAAVIGDNYTNEESIKSSERAHRGNIQMQEIRNPTRVTPLPKQCLKLLSNPKNKANIANFLLTDWIKKCEKELPEGREIYLSGGFHDMKRAVKVVCPWQSVGNRRASIWPRRSWFCFCILPMWNKY